LQDLELLGKESGGIDDDLTEASRLKLEFVTKVCSPPRTLDPQLHSWVALFCQQAAEVFGEDFAVGRVPKPAAVEVARCVWNRFILTTATSCYHMLDMS
jgi:hypothetical protein